MNTPSPLIPQGSLQKPGSKARSNASLVVLGVIAIHAVFFVGLLMQGGCKREDPRTTLNQDPTTPTAEDKFYSDYTELTRRTTPAPETFPPTVAVKPQLPAVPADALPVAPAPTPAPIIRSPSVAPVVMPSPMAPEIGTREYTVQKGDSFYAIGKQFGVSMNDIAKANPGVDPARLQVGQKLQVPEASATVRTLAANNSVAPSPSGNVYVVKAGDTLTHIAKAHGTTIQALRTVNGLKSDRINVQQKLIIPTRSASQGQSAGGAVMQ